MKLHKTKCWDSSEYFLIHLKMKPHQRVYETVWFLKSTVEKSKRIERVSKRRYDCNKTGSINIEIA